MAETGEVSFDVFPAGRIPSNRSVEMPTGPSKRFLREQDHTHRWPQSHTETSARKAQGMPWPKKGRFVPVSREISLAPAGDGKLGWRKPLSSTGPASQDPVPSASALCQARTETSHALHGQASALSWATCTMWPLGGTRS